MAHNEELTHLPLKVIAKPIKAARLPLLSEIKRLLTQEDTIEFGDLHGEWDSDRLTQVVSNLVANALQYGCEDGPVSVVAQQQGEEVVLRVHNGGPLISDNAIKKLFEPMVRQPTDGDKNPTGLGLGLYIAREVVTAHGGTIGVTSTEKDETTLTVRLPRRPPEKTPID